MSVFLPKTEFNIYSDSKEVEKNTLQYWEEIDLQKLREEKRKGAQKFVVHDGPPYANGPIHMGHAENKFWKDVLNKFFFQAGYDVNYIPGWDAHGLPIENAVEKELKADGIDKRTLSRQEFWDKCYNFAFNWMTKQKEQFKNMAIFADYENSYATFFEKESIGIIKCIHEFVQKDLLKQKYRPVLWSIAEKTALAYAEVEYKDKISNSIYISFKVAETDIGSLKDANLVIWTTTPWTLPCNETVAYNKDFEYIVIESDAKKYCVCQDLFDSIKDLFKDHIVIAKIKGEKLLNTVVLHPLKEFHKTRTRKLIHSDHVTKEMGTGFVHIAPAHGEEDFQLGKDRNLIIEDLFDEHGYFKKSVPLVFEKNVKEAEKIILEELKLQDTLLLHKEIKHSYPHSWRSKAPLIYRLTKQWFLEIAPLKEKAMNALKDDLKWIPQESKNRFTSMLEGRQDWCISRQRIWGVPIAIFYNKNTGEVLKDEEFLTKSTKKIEEVGVKNWWNLNISEIDEQYEDKDWIRVEDIVDVWFESGATQSFILQEKGLFPCDVYLEGSDQHRGWFQSSLLISAFQTGKAPWKNLITHGFCLDSQKQKMSKSIGNVVNPASWNVDELRVFFASMNLCTDISINANNVKNSKETLFRFKNTIKFILGMLAIEGKAQEVDYEKLPKLEKWLLNKVYEIDEEYKKVLTTYQVNNYLTAIYEFCSQDLSAFYFDIRKEALYCETKDNDVRKASVSCLKIIAPILIKYLAPIMPFCAEEAWHCYLKESDQKKSSVHLENKPEIPAFYNNQEAANYIDNIREIRKDITQKIEVLREEKKLKTNAEAKVFVPNDLYFPELKEVAIVAQVQKHDNNEIVVEVMDGQKCRRCRFICQDVVNEVCIRCAKVESEV